MTEVASQDGRRLYDRHLLRSHPAILSTPLLATPDVNCSGRRYVRPIQRIAWQVTAISAKITLQIRTGTVR